MQQSSESLWEIPKNLTAAAAPVTNFTSAILELLLREKDFVLQGFCIVQYLCSVKGGFFQTFCPQALKGLTYKKSLETVQFEN